MSRGRKWRSMSPNRARRWNSSSRWATGCRSPCCSVTCAFRWRRVSWSGRPMVWRLRRPKDRHRRSRERETSMTEEADIELLDHELADDELAWMKAVHDEFGRLRAAFARRETAFNPKEALREILGRDEYRFGTQADLSGPGPW